MDCLIANLKLEKGELYGRKLFFLKWRKIKVSDIEKVRVYGWNNPFLQVWTKQGKYKLGVLRGNYGKVFNFLKENELVDSKSLLTNSYNDFMCRTPFFGLFKNKIQKSVVSVENKEKADAILFQLNKRRNQSSTPDTKKENNTSERCEGTSSSK